MKKQFMWFIMTLLLTNSSFAIVVTNIAQLDGLAEFSFSVMSDNKGYSSASGAPEGTYMTRVEDWIAANSEFCIGAGDHFIGTRLSFQDVMKNDTFWHNNFYPQLGDNDLETKIVASTQIQSSSGVTGNQWDWGRAWVIHKNLNNFFNRSDVEFRPTNSTPVSSYVSKTDKTHFTNYTDRLVDYYVCRTIGNFTVHIISVNYGDHTVFAPRSKDFMMDKLTELGATKTKYDIIVVVAHTSRFMEKATAEGFMTWNEVDQLMTTADMVIDASSHKYGRWNIHDSRYDGTEAYYVNSGAPLQSGGSEFTGYLDVHVFDAADPFFTVQFINVQLNTTRKLTVGSECWSSANTLIAEEDAQPFIKYINGAYMPVDWNNFQINAPTSTIPTVSFAVPTGNVTVNEGSDLYVKVNATDPDGISQVRLYKNGVKLARNEAGAPYEWALSSQNDPELKNLQPGSFILTAEATDTQGTIGTTTASITVTVQAVNQAPYFSTDPFSLANATNGTAYSKSFSSQAVDPEGGTKTFSKTAGPEWLTVTQTGTAQGTPGSVDVGTNSFIVKVADSGGLYDTATMTITVESGNLPPYFTEDPFAKPTATAGTAYNEPFSGKATDPEGGTMTFSKVSGPAWMTVDPTGRAQGTPSNADIGTNTFVVRVTDNGALSDTATMTIPVVGGAVQTVTFTSVAAEDGYLNESSETSGIGGGFNATGTAGAGLRIGDTTTKQQHKSVVSFDTSSIPDGAVIQSATLKLMRGAISGTPTTLGLIKVDIKGSTGFSGSTAVQNGDFEAAADATNVATMSYPSANGTLSTGSLNSTGLTKVNKTGKTQLRVYFATDDDNDTTSDYLGFYPAENATEGNRPVLEVTYQ